MKIIFFDVETTGLPISWKEKYTNKSNWPYIVQLAYIISYEDKEISEEQDYILKPEGFSIPEKSTIIHGISNEEAIKRGNSRKHILHLFATHLKNSDYIVAHNTDFDINVLRCEFLRNNIEDPFNEDVKIICTMKQSKNFCKLPTAYGDYKWPSLQELYSKLFGEYFNESHNAKVDVKATFECFWKLHQLNIIKIKQNEKNQEPILDRNFWLSFFKERKNLFFELISLYYPLDEDLLVLFENKLHWENVSRNTAINWNIEIIEKFQDKWGFQVSYMGWPNGPIKWYGLSSNPNLPWSIELITAYKENWAFYDHSDYNAGTVSTNSALPWSNDLLEEFKDEWNWDELSASSFLPWHKISIQNFKDFWNPKLLSGNISLPWSIYFIAKNQDFWDWPIINQMIIDGKIILTTKEVMKAYFEDEIKIRYMVYLPLNEQFIDLAIDSWEFNWDCLGGHGILPWTAKLIRKYLPKMGAATYIRNDTIDWNIELLRQLDNIFLWSHFAFNERFNWGEDFFKEFEHKINFDENQYDSYKLNWQHLKQNKAIIWSEFLLERYYDYLKNDKSFWEELSWGNLTANWTPKIIENYKEHWDWKWLSQNESLCFSDSLIRKYEKCWDWSYLTLNSSIKWPLNTLEFYINRFSNDDYDFCSDADSIRFSGLSQIISNLSEKYPGKKRPNSFLDNLNIFMSLDDDDDWASPKYDIWQSIKGGVWENCKDEISKDFIIQINNS